MKIVKAHQNGISGESEKNLQQRTFSAKRPVRRQLFLDSNQSDVLCNGRPSTRTFLARPSAALRSAARAHFSEPTWSSSSLLPRSAAPASACTRPRTRNTRGRAPPLHLEPNPYDVSSSLIFNTYLLWISGQR